MAATNPARQNPDESTDAGVGLAHPTVVPTNFDPSEVGEADERDE